MRELHIDYSISLDYPVYLGRLTLLVDNTAVLTIVSLKYTVVDNTAVLTIVSLKYTVPKYTYRTVLACMLV